MFVHFSDDNSDILKDVNFAEIIDFDTSLSEKVGVQNILFLLTNSKYHEAVKLREPGK